MPRAPEHQVPPSVPGGAIGRVLDRGDCDDFGWYVVLDAYVCTESSLGPGLSVPHTLTRVPRAPEHQAPPSVPGGAIGWVLDCGDCGDFGWYQTLVERLN